MTEKERKIKITAGKHVLVARALWNKLPQTYSMQNLYEREMCFRMGKGSLPAKEAKYTGYKIGDISYWPPRGSLVILYAQNGEIFEQQPIGHIADDVTFFKNLGDTKIKFERVEE